MSERIVLWIYSAIIIIITITSSSSLAAVFQVSNPSQLHSALQNAQSNGQHDTIRIAQGSYIGNFLYSSHATGDLIIEGGWRNDFSGRVIKADNTVLDGNQNGSVFIFSCDKPSNLTIDGITFQNGRHSNDGAGIYIFHQYDNWSTGLQKITIKNNIIKNNSVTKDDNGARGIGLYILTYAEISITNNIITENQPLDLDQSSTSGGGMYLGTNDKLDIINNLIHNNKAAGGGGVSIEVYSQRVRIIGNTISNNEATYRGGGIYASNWVRDTPSIISSNIFSGNNSGRYSGGLFWDSGGGDLAITNNQFTGNMATWSGGGATIFAGSDQVKTIDFINNTVASNQAGTHGGGFEILMRFDGSVLNLYNNIFWQNTSTNPGYDMYLDNDYDDNYLAGICNLYNNNFNQSGWGIYMDIPFAIHASNLNHKDPLFAGAWSGNYMLGTRSPSINTGNNNAPSLPATDLLGNVRIQDGIVDMGAYEGATTRTYPVLAPLMLLLK